MESDSLSDNVIYKLKSLSVIAHLQSSSMLFTVKYSLARLIAAMRLSGLLRMGGIELSKQCHDPRCHYGVLITHNYTAIT